jgi:diadenosine hexaphosphate hydrolase (ATP-forming)
MAHSERSAGVVVFRNDLLAPGGRVFLLLDYGKYWEYPKGHVEPGDEDDLAAALRELREETGISDAAVVPGFAHEIQYFFRDRKRGLIRKTVVFFLARTDATDLKISHEHAGAGFFPLDEAIKRLSFPNSKQVLRLAVEHLNHHPDAAHP